MRQEAFMKASFKQMGVTDIACALPKNIVKLTDLSSYFDIRDINRITQSTGIHSVRQAPDEISTIDLCRSACLSLLQGCAIDPVEIDGIIVVTQTPHQKMPALSGILQHELKLSINTVTFDINQGCSGFINGLYLASCLVNSGGCKKVIVCVGDTLTKYLDPFDKSVRFVFGDGAAATLVQQTSESMDFILKSDGSGANFLSLKESDQSYLFMDGSKVMEFVLREVPSIVDEMLSFVNWNKHEIHHYLFHQPNVFMLEYLRKKIGINKNVMPICIDGIGNTSSASIPVTLCFLRDSLQNNNKLSRSILCGFGVGLSWSACTLNLSETNLYPPIEI